MGFVHPLERGKKRGGKGLKVLSIIAPALMIAGLVISGTGAIVGVIGIFNEESKGIAIALLIVSIIFLAACAVPFGKKKVSYIIKIAVSGLSLLVIPELLFITLSFLLSGILTM